jgi:hypothetical protein
MSSRTIGTCSICGGRVSVPDHWMGIHPPIPTCDSCGAHMKQPHGPVVPMEKPGGTEGLKLGRCSGDRWMMGPPRARWD